MAVKQAYFNYDRWIILSSLSLLAIGLLMIASASMVISDRQYGYSLHYFIHQIVYLFAGFVAALVMTRIKLEYLQRQSGYLMLIGLMLLVLVLVPHVGKEVNGGMRWLGVGPFSFQVSEFIKLFVVI